MAALGLCLLGCGYIAQRHAQAARSLRPEVALSFASRDPGRAEAYRRAFRGVAAFPDYEAAVRDPRVHAVLICTPHHLHAAHAALAFRHGKHVLVEKPIASSLEDADAMIAGARGAGMILMVAENFWFMPAMVAARRLIQEGRLGAVSQIQLVARGYRVPSPWRCRRAEAGGGALIDGGIHYVNLLRQCGGEVAEVYALRPPQTIAEMEGEDSVCLLVRLRSGAVGVLVNSIGTPGTARTQCASVSGTEGTLLIENRGRFLLLRARRGRRFLVFLRDRRGHGAMLREFVATIREGRRPQMAGEEGRTDLAVVLAAYRSLDLGQPVEVPPSGLP